MTAKGLIYLLEEVRKLEEDEFAILKKALRMVYLQQEEGTTDRIHNVLIRLGITPNLKGYQCIKYSVQKGFQDPDVFKNITKGLYLQLDKEFCGGGERAIRVAIEKAQETDPLLFTNIFGSRKKITASEFLSTLTEYLRV